MVINLLLALQNILSKFCVIAFPHATISLAAVCDWDTVKEKKYFFSVQVLFLIPTEQLELVDKIHFVLGCITVSI